MTEFLLFERCARRPASLGILDFLLLLVPRQKVRTSSTTYKITNSKEKYGIILVKKLIRFLNNRISSSLKIYEISTCSASQTILFFFPTCKTIRVGVGSKINFAVAAGSVSNSINTPASFPTSIPPSAVSLKVFAK